MRRTNYRRSAPRRKSRPTDRIIQGRTSTVAGSTQVSIFQWTATVPCTVTNFKLDIGSATNDEIQVFPYVLVHVPQGYGTNTINYPTSPSLQLYEPTKNVLISGVVTDPTLEDHKWSKYSRKCQEGDSIALIIMNPTVTPFSCAWELSFTTVH